MPKKKSADQKRRERRSKLRQRSVEPHEDRSAAKQSSSSGTFEIQTEVGYTEQATNLCAENRQTKVISSKIKESGTIDKSVSQTKDYNQEDIFMDDDSVTSRDSQLLTVRATKTETSTDKAKEYESSKLRDSQPSTSSASKTKTSTQKAKMDELLKLRDSPSLTVSASKTKTFIQKAKMDELTKSRDLQPSTVSASKTKTSTQKAKMDESTKSRDLQSSTVSASKTETSTQKAKMDESRDLQPSTSSASKTETSTQKAKMNESTKSRDSQPSTVSASKTETSTQKAKIDELTKSRKLQTSTAIASRTETFRQKPKTDESMASRDSQPSTVSVSKTKTSTLKSKQTVDSEKRANVHDRHITSIQQKADGLRKQNKIYRNLFENLGGNESELEPELSEVHGESSADHKKRTDRDNTRKRVAQYRECLPEDRRQQMREIDRKRKQSKRKTLSDETKDAIKESERKRKQNQKDNLSKDDILTLRDSNKKSKQKKRQNLSDQKRDSVRESDRKRKQDQRESLPDELKDTIKESDRKRKKQLMENLSDDEIVAMRDSNKKSKQKERQNLSDQKRDSMRESDRKRKEDQRESLPDEVKDSGRKADKKRKQDQRESLPDEVRDFARKADKKRKQDQRESLPDEVRDFARKADKKRKQDQRESLPDEVRDFVRESERKRKRTDRENLSDTEREEIRTRDRTRRSVNRRLNLDNSYQTFLKNIKSGPSNICICCQRLLYEQTAQKITKSTFKRVDQDILREVLPGWTFDDNATDYICKTCLASLQKKKIPPQATVNELQLTELKEPLSTLTDFEARLVSQRLIFMKILALPRGRQKAVHGTVVNVPVDSSQTCTLLPRLPTNSGLVPVKLKRKLQYRGHVEFQHISPDRVISSLLYLKENNEFYKDVPVLENWRELASGDDPSLWERLTGTNTAMDDSADKDMHGSEEDDTNDKDQGQDDNDDEWSGDDDDLLNAEDMPQTRGITYDTCIQQEYRGNEVVSIAPGEGKTPVSLLLDDNNEVLAFPKLFPDGKFGFDSKRKSKLSVSRYFNARLLHKDSRFARNTDYIFYAQHIRDLQHINDTISVAMRKASSSKLNAGQAKDSSQMANLILKDHGYKFLSQIRGSPAYFDKMLLELLACVKQLGAFTWFITLSAADLQWPEGIQIIGRQYGHDFTEQDVKDMSWEERCRWIRQNPVTIARHFDYRLKQFIRNVILSPQQPVGKVTMYMYRIEFQQRGSPHAHMAFWVDGAPDFDRSTEEEIRNFHDRYVSCDIPDDDEELSELVKKVQTHTHSPSCRKSGKSCRFSFPKPPTDRTIIIKAVKETEESQQEEVPIQPNNPADNMTDAQVKATLALVNTKLDELEEDMTTQQLLHEIGLPEELYYAALSRSRKTDAVIMKRQPSQRNVNNYNPELLRLWKANLDIQLVCNPYACIMYIASYISKAERTLGDLLKNISKESAKLEMARQLRTVASKFLTHREVSAQEATYRVLSLPLCYFDRQRIFVSTNPPTERVKFLKPRAVIEQMEDDDEDIYQGGLLERYSMRPVNLTGMCLAEFAVTYTTSYSKTETEDTNPEVIATEDDQESPQYITLTDGRKMVKRKKTAIIRTHKVSQKKDPEKYSYALLLLYVPWRNEERDIGPSTFDGDYFQTKLTNHQEEVNTMIQRFEKHAQLIEVALQDIEQNGPPDEDAWAHLNPETVQANLDAAREGAADDENANFMDPARNQVPTGDPSLESPQVVYEVMASMLTDAQWRDHIHSLNEEQTLVHNFFVNWCTQLCQSKKIPPKPDPFYLFVTGGAGAGKSHLIKAIQETSFRLLRPVTENPGDITVLTAAPTGTAAFNVHGMTLHSAFLLPVMQGFTTYKPLSQEKLNTLRCKLSSLQVIIIDEISMVSADLLLYLHRRLQEITGSTEIFGGLSIFTFGDLFQLAPPAQKALYDKPSDEMARLYGSLWTKHFKVLELQQIMRQRDDLSFAKLLNRVRIGKQNEKDLKTLRTRETNDPPSDIIHVFTRNKDVDNYNNLKLESLPTAQIIIKAQDSKKDCTTGAIAVSLSEKASETGGLRSSISLAVGARILLTYNVNTADGLVNGAKGTVKGFVPAPPDPVDDNYSPKMVLVKFDNKDIGHQTRQIYKNHLQRHPSLIPIIRQQVKVKLGKHSTVNASRHQFPLTLAWATTIHKVQGDTLDSIAIHFNGSFQPGQLYVALSRVKSLDGLFLVKFDEQKIHTSLKTIKETKRLTDTMKFFPPKTLSYLPETSAIISISTVNAQSLHRHFHDVTNHPSARSAHILGITETFLMPSDRHSDYDWKNHFLFRRDRYQSMANATTPTSRTEYAAHGGVAIYVSDQYHVDLLCQLYRIPVECIAVVVTNRDSSRKLCYAVTYRPPKQNLQSYLINMDNVMRHLPHLNLPTVISGDFNVNLLAESQDQKTLAQFFGSYGFQQVIERPTHISGSLLDHMYCNFNLTPDVYRTVQPTYFSQHSFVQIVPQQ